MILYLAKGSLLATVLMTIVAGNILGMGLPTAASYVVMAIMAAPALIQLGVIHHARQEFVSAIERLDEAAERYVDDPRRTELSLAITRAERMAHPRCMTPR